MMPYDNIEVMPQNQVVVVWIWLRKTKKLREPKINLQPTTKTVNCFCRDINNKKINIRDNGNNNGDGDNNNNHINDHSSSSTRIVVIKIMIKLIIKVMIIKVTIVKIQH